MNLNLKKQDLGGNMNQNIHTKQNLYQKLVEVRKSVEYIQKNAKGYNFQYANETQILGAIRGKMDELNVFLEIDMIALDPVECEYMADKALRKIAGLKATIIFTWTDADNPTDQIKKQMIVQDSESEITTVGGLLTYANRYFLYKFFSVPTDKEDPDTFENRQDKLKGERPQDTKKPPAPDAAAIISPQEAQEIENVIHPEDKQYREDLLKYFSTVTKTKMDNFFSLPKRYLEGCLRSARKRRTELEAAQQMKNEEEVDF